ncbi:hypothetical protein [Micromonospora sp. NPDC049679]|uniref:hypothetical protein n=1 Tax=Micromonospora sp. NPDC049679 TaxID=3155920 RepID=UPI0033FAC51D
MSGFFADVDGMNGLYNLLHRASGDAADTKQYMVKHCDLSFGEEGYIMIMAGPHYKAYTEMSDAFSNLTEITKSAATQINLAQSDYRRSDESSASRLDATYAGAQDPAAVRGTTAQGRPDLWARQRAAFGDAAEPTSNLVDPSYFSGVEKWEINLLSDAISPAAWVRQVSVWVFGWDPFEAWAKNFSGDWKAYEHCAAAWGKIGAAAMDIGRNLSAGAGDVPSVWRGNAAEAEQEFQLRVASAAMHLQSVCAEYHRLYMQTADATKNLWNVVSGLIGKLIDVLIIVNAAAVVGTATSETIVGGAVGYGVAAYYIWQAYNLYQEISAVFGNAEAGYKAIAGTISAIDAKLKVDNLPELQSYRHPAGY